MLAGLSYNACASTAIPTERYDLDWALGLKVRRYTLPFDTDSPALHTQETIHRNLSPLFYLQGKYIFLHGEEGGIHLYRTPQFNIDAVAQMQLIDLPKAHQNQKKGATGHYGLELDYHHSKQLYTRYAMMSDEKGHTLFKTRLGWIYHTENWRFEPLIETRYYTSGYTSRYFGLEQTKLKGGLILKAGGDLRYHLFSDLYVIGHTHFSTFHHNICRSLYIKSCIQFEYGLGFLIASSPQKSQSTLPSTKIKPDSHQLRFSYGLGVDTNLENLFILKSSLKNTVPEDKLYSVFYGYKVAEELFSAHIDVYPTAGLAYHYNSEDKRSSPEFILGIQLYYTIPLGVRTRFGFIEGISYITHVTQTEYEDVMPKYKPHQFSNYLNISLDINLGDILNLPQINYVWLGYSMHHRSSVFEQAAQYGRIKGGSNFHT